MLLWGCLLYALMGDGLLQYNYNLLLVFEGEKKKKRKLSELISYLGTIFLFLVSLEKEFEVDS